jgi:hypothetical protein
MPGVEAREKVCQYLFPGLEDVLKYHVTIFGNRKEINAK